MIFSGTTTKFMIDYYIKEKQNELSRAAIRISVNISDANYLFDESKHRLFVAELENRSKEGLYRILVFNDRAEVVNDSGKTEIGKTYLLPEVIEALQGKERVTNLQPNNIIYAAKSISAEGNKLVGAVLIVASTEDIYKPVSDLENYLLILIGITIVVVTLLVFFISQLLIDPLKDTVNAVQKMADGHLNIRTSVKGKDEFSELGESFNNMAEKLEQVEKTREEFVSNVSHELKTPLSSIKVLTESILLQENVPIEMYNEFLHDINSEIDRMTNIVNDLLNLVKLDQREIGLNFKNVDLSKLCIDILKRLYPLAEIKNIELLFEEEKKITIEADEMKLSLAISNLIENGIKYTLNGGTVKVIVDGDHQNAFITVQDTGLGIPEDEQSKIFNRFYRTDKTRDRETGGTGLGLSITHSTALLHHGSIRLSSKENEGSTFVMRLPIHQNK